MEVEESNESTNDDRDLVVNQYSSKLNTIGTFVCMVYLDDLLDRTQVHTPRDVLFNELPNVNP